LASGVGQSLKIVLRAFREGVFSEVGVGLWHLASWWGVVGVQGSTRRRSMSAEENKTLVRRFVDEVQSKGNIDAIDEFLFS
jgi:hypothetical protein